MFLSEEYVKLYAKEVVEAFGHSVKATDDSYKSLGYTLFDSYVGYGLYMTVENDVVKVGCSEELRDHKKTEFVCIFEETAWIPGALVYNSANGFFFEGEWEKVLFALHLALPDLLAERKRKWDICMIAAKCRRGLSFDGRYRLSNYSSNNPEFYLDKKVRVEKDKKDYTIKVFEIFKEGLFSKGEELVFDERELFMADGEWLEHIEKVIEKRGYLRIPEIWNDVGRDSAWHIDDLVQEDKKKRSKPEAWKMLLSKYLPDISPVVVSAGEEKTRGQSQETKTGSETRHRQTEEKAPVRGLKDGSSYYEILRVSKDATSEEIKAAYRKLSKQYHPDTNRGSKLAEEEFKRINAAYEVLSDPVKRARYDQYGKI